MIVSLRYDRSKLSWLTLIAVLTIALLVTLLTHPEFQVGGGYGMLVNTGFGRSFVMPALLLCMLTLLARTITMLTGKCDAATANGEGVKVSTVWRSHWIPWSDLRNIDVTKSTFGGSAVFTAVFYKQDGSQVSLPLGAVDLPDNDARATVAALGQARPQANTISQSSAVEVGFGRRRT